MNQKLCIFFVSAVVVHIVFCLQAIAAARHGGLILNEALLVAFAPHAFLMFFLPPQDPFAVGDHVNWLRFVGKLADAIPASLMYGAIFAAVFTKRASNLPNQSTDPTLASGTASAEHQPRHP